MSVKLVWITPEAEKIISYCARVSNPINQDNYSTSSKLLKYCAKNGHWSIFEMASMCIEVNTTRAISAQIIRHKSLNFQEFSQRYSAIDDSALEIPSLRRQDLKNRQNSIDDIPELNNKYKQRIQEQYNSSLQLYQDMLQDGVAKECARFVLPMSTQTRLYVSGTIRSWIHYCQLRCDPSTQKEHRELAIQIRDLLIEHIPSISDLLKTDN
jgi:thymidylate synthase (FAD)